MTIFTARARPRLTRLSTSSISSTKKKGSQMYVYMYIMAVALLLIASVSILQLGLGRSSFHAAHDAIRTRKETSEAEDSRVNRQKGESGAVARQEQYIETERPSRKKRTEMLNFRNRPKVWKIRSVGKREVGNGWIEEVEEGGSQGKEKQFFSDFDGRVIDLNDEDTDDFESGSLEEELDEGQGYTEKAQMYQGQQLEDMDRFDKGQATEDAHKHQGQLLDDMEKFDNRQVTESTSKHQFKEDTVPMFVQKLSELRGVERNRKHQMVGNSRAAMQAKGSSLVSENITRLHQQEGKKESRKLGYRGDYGRDMLRKEREGEEQELHNKPGRLVAGQSGSEDRILPANAIKRTSETPKGSIRAAIEQEMKKRNGVFSRGSSMGVRQRSMEEAGDSLRLNPGETNPNSASSYVKNSAKRTHLEKSVGTSKPPLRGFKEVFENMKVSNDNDESLDTNVLQKDVMSEDAVMLDEGSSQGNRLLPWDIEKKGEAGIVDSLNLAKVKENKGDIKQSTRSAQKTAEVQNSDSIKLNALAMEEKTSSNKRFDHDEHLKLIVDVLKAQEHLESADLLQSDKQLIKEDTSDNVEDDSDDVEKEIESRKTNEDDPAVEEKEDDEHDNLIQWGFYPTLSRTLKFSIFLSAFFKQERCSLRIFMAWTTAPWAYTPRHQRAIESILHFHPHACIVVFTETIDFKFFDSWVKEGYKIAVARPNLEELLEKTPAIDFAYVWNEWRDLNLFYIHYTELLRITALHKYGGVWLDMDVILARPLPKLHNVLGSTVSEGGEWFLNGAFMSFDKSSSFLKACIEEFVATYDETSLEWNGADLLNRVASNATKKGGKVWLEESDHLQVLEPIAFFPLSRHNIIRYFSAPKSNHEKVEQKKDALSYHG